MHGNTKIKKDKSDSTKGHDERVGSITCLSSVSTQACHGVTLTFTQSNLIHSVSSFNMQSTAFIMWLQKSVTGARNKPSFLVFLTH